MLIKIYKIEQLVGRDSGNPYWKLETSQGGMSAFDKLIADKLYEAWKQEKEIEVDAQPSKDGKYVNIRRLGGEKPQVAQFIAGVDDRGFIKPEKPQVPGTHKKERHEFAYDTPEKQRKYDEDSRQYDEMHQETPMKLDGQAVTVQKPQDLGKSNTINTNNTFNPTSMYVSYAKDIFIGLDQERKIAREALNADDIELDLNQVMQTAINLVKQAHEAFS